MNNNLKIMDLPIEERPEEKLLALGAEVLTNSELLAIILRTGTKGENVLSLCQRILSNISGLEGLYNLSLNEAKAIKGIKNTKGAQLLAIAELSKRINSLDIIKNKVKIASPKDVFDVVRGDLEFENQEVLRLLILNTKHIVIKKKDIFKGSLNTSVVHPREIYKEAISISGAAIIVCHNHPSGDPQPSKEDINITVKLKESGKILGIELLDHVIIGKNSYVSLKEKGIL